MAKRRMFSLDIIDNDVFLDMPQSSQMLYFHLGMRADDDGFISPKKVMRMVGANHDDLLVLITKRYVLQFDSGVVVIKHWPVNNYIQKDRYVQSTYSKEKATLTRNEFGAYTEKNRIGLMAEEIEKIEKHIRPTVVTEMQGSHVKPTTPEQIENDAGIQNVSTLEPQVRLGKDSIGYINNTTDVVLGPDKPVRGKPEINEMFEFWEQTIGYVITSRKQSNRNACNNLLKKFGEEKLKQLVIGVQLAQADTYAPRIADFIQLQSKTNELILWGRKRGIDSASAEF